MKHRRRIAVAAPLVLISAFLVPGAPVQAHPDHGGGNRELFPGEGVVLGGQHGGSEGHLPPVQRGVKLVGKAAVTNPSGAGNEGRVADVSAYRNHAFLTAFRDPTCERTGAHVINIKDPTRPYEVTGAFMPTTEGNYAGEGSDVITMNNTNFTGALFIHQNETCPDAAEPTAPRTRGGINIWNVSNPERPELLVAHAGDYTGDEGQLEDQANQTHSQFAWTNKYTGRTYVVLVDDEEATDLDILDITDPRSPVLVNDSLNLSEEPFNVTQDEPANLRSVFSHDMVVKQVGRRYVMSASYWDGGYVLLDVTDPTPGKVSLIAETDYAALDEERLARGQRIAPEGNAHQSELSPNNKHLVATDEDFNPYRIVATISSGPYAGTEYSATPAPDAAPIDADTSITGTPTFVGTGCPGTVAAGDGVALIERGGCPFQQKLDTVAAAGYDAGIVFNSQVEDCTVQITMAAAGSIPFVFVNRPTGLRLLGAPGVTDANACTTATPTASAVAATSISSVFDGWGYVRLFQTVVPTNPRKPGIIRQIDTYAIPESQDPRYATGFGDLSVHEVALDPEKKLAYVSYYAGGLRVLRYGDNGITEVGAFIDEGGNNFWGVEVHRIGGKQYVLASDRDYGLYIFQAK